MNKTWLQELNDSVNVLAFCIVLYTPILIHQGAKDLAGQLVAGAIGLMGGKALNNAARRAADFNGGNGNGKTTDNGNSPAQSGSGTGGV